MLDHDTKVGKIENIEPRNVFYVLDKYQGRISSAGVTRLGFSYRNLSPKAVKRIEQRSSEVEREQGFTGHHGI